MTTEDHQAATAKALDDASVANGKATMYVLAQYAREEHPSAKVLDLRESDQGDWLTVWTVETDEDDEAELDNDGGYASSLYSDVWALRELYSEFDVRGAIEYSPRQGITSFRMDVAKVLAECGPEPVNNQPPAGRVPPLHLWGERDGIYIHAAGFIDGEEDGTAYYLNADHRPDQPGISLNREEVTALVEHAQAWLEATS